LPILVCLCLTFVPHHLHAQNNADGHNPVGNSNSLYSTLLSDFNHVSTAPFHPTKNEMIGLSVLTVMTAALINRYDDHIRDAFATTSSFRDNGAVYVAQKVAWLGSGYDRLSPAVVLGGLGTGLLMGGVLARDPHLVLTARLVIESIALAGGLTVAGKALIGRSRPFTDNGAQDFHFFQFSRDRALYSFPSGHTSTITAAMTVIAQQYNSWWVKIPAYTLCASVALERIRDDQHWTSDVIVAGALGYWIGRTLAGRYQHAEHISGLQPYWTPKGIGVCYRF
jgi:membrane-associated phospholipid phosphatase